MFISMAYIILDKVTGTATLARAGHDALLWYKAVDGSVEKLTPKGMALGIDSGEVFNRVSTDFTLNWRPRTASSSTRTEPPRPWTWRAWNLVCRGS